MTRLRGVLTCTIMLIVMMGYGQIDSFMHDGGFRNYLLHLPTGYDSTQQYPLVLNIHGLSENSTHQQDYTGMSDVADQNNFIVVYPNSNSGFWNSGIDVLTIDDKGFLSELIDTIAANYSVNTDRVYSCGFSNGALMTYHMACNYSNKIAAMASVVGSMSTGTFNNCNPNRALPVLQIHGMADSSIPYEGKGIFTPIDTVLSFWRNNNNITAPVEYGYFDNISTTDNSDANLYYWRFGNDSSEVALIKINGGEHTWAGSSNTTLGTTNQDFNASEFIWEFFDQFDINGRINTKIYDITINTSIDEVNFGNGGMVYPNPFSNTLNLSGFGKVEELSLYNIAGKQVFTTKGNAPIKLSSADIKPGIYLLQVKTNKGVQVVRVVKE